MECSYCIYFLNTYSPACLFWENLLTFISFPSPKMQTLQSYNKPRTFYLASFLLSAVFFFACAYLSHQEQTTTILILENSLAIIGVSMPALIAFRLIKKDSILLQDLKARAIRFDKSFWKYLLVILGLTFWSLLLAQLISLPLGYSVEQFIVTGNPSFSTFLFSTWFIIVFAAIVEELARHSYGIDTLRRKFSLITTNLIFAVYWVAWHLPLATINGYYHSNLVTEWRIYWLNFACSAVIFVFLINWLYYKSGRNLWIAVFFHVFANVGNELFSTHPDSKIIQTWILLLFLIILVIKDRKLFFQNNKTS